MRVSNSSEDNIKEEELLLLKDDEEVDDEEVGDEEVDDEEEEEELLEEDRRGGRGRYRRLGLVSSSTGSTIPVGCLLFVGISVRSATRRLDCLDSTQILQSCTIMLSHF
jgi:hypothetical protein